MSTQAGRVVIPVPVDDSPSSVDDGRHELAGTKHASPSIVESLAPTQLVVLGYWPVPDQSVPRQLRDRFEDEAQETLAQKAAVLEGYGAEVVTELSFTRDRNQLIDAVTNRYDCTSVLFPGTTRTTPPESVLVLLRSDEYVDRVVSTLGSLFADSDVDIELFHALEDDDDVGRSELMLRGVGDQLAERGVDPDRVHWEQSERGTRVDSIVSRVAKHDLVVLGETKPSVRERLFGRVQSGIVDRTERPLLTVRVDW